MACVIALDIGGTSVKAGLVSESGTLFERARFEVQEDGLTGAVRTAARVMALRARQTGAAPCGVAAAATGQIDSRCGQVVGTNGAIAGWEGVHLTSLLQQETGLARVCVANDANCAAYLEATRGAGRGRDEVLLVTLGTGIGGGIVQGGKLLDGARGLAGEIGHICVDPRGRRCTCGRRGCWERYASVGALVRDAAAAGGAAAPRNGKEVFALEQAGNAAVHAVMERYFDFLALGLANLIHIFNPDAVILGGGVSAEGERLLGRVRPRLEKSVMPQFLQGLALCTAAFQNDAGLLGAAALFFGGGMGEK